MRSWLAPAPSTRTRILRRNRAGTCRRAAASTSLWSVKVFDPALPGRSSMARHSRVLRAPGAQRVEAVAFLPGGSRSFLVRAGGDQGGVHVDDQPARSGSSRRSASHGNPAGVPAISVPGVRPGLRAGAGDPVQHGRRPGQVQGAADRRPARRGPEHRGEVREQRDVAHAGGPERDRGRQRDQHDAPVEQRRACPSSAAPRSAARSARPGRRPCGAGPRRRGRPGPSRPR